MIPLRRIPEPPKRPEAMVERDRLREALALSVEVNRGTGLSAEKLIDHAKELKAALYPDRPKS